MRRWVLVIVILVSLVTIASDTIRPAGPYSNVKNVIIIAVDTLAAQNLGFMGYGRDTCPFMVELASRSVVFNRAYTPESKTEPSFTSLLTGLHPGTHGIIENGTNLPPDLHLLTVDFQSAGFDTWGIPAADVINGRYGFYYEFDYYSHAPPRPLPASRIIEKITGILEKHPRFGEPEFSMVGRPLFLMLHFYDPHTEYTPDETILADFANPSYNGPVDGMWENFKKFNHYEIEYTSADLRHVRDLYDAEIRTFDNRLRELFDLFERTGLIDNSVIVLTADHGENLGEHHFITHGLPYENSLHIPLLFHFPDDKWAGTRIDDLVEITDIVPTLMEATGVPIPANIDGQSLLTLIDPGLPSMTTNFEATYIEREYLFSLGRVPNSELPTSITSRISTEPLTYSIFDGTHRLITEYCPENPAGIDYETFLYNIDLDPLESFNIFDQYNVPLLTLAPLLEQNILSCHDGHISEIDPETLQMLASLGYL